MTRRPDADDPEPQGGRAAERLRDFMRRRSADGNGVPGPPWAGHEHPDPDPDADDGVDAEDEPAP